MSWLLGIGLVVVVIVAAHLVRLFLADRRMCDLMKNKARAIATWSRSEHRSLRAHYRSANEQDIIKTMFFRPEADYFFTGEEKAQFERLCTYVNGPCYLAEFGHVMNTPLKVMGIRGTFYVDAELEKQGFPSITAAEKKMLMDAFMYLANHPANRHLFRDIDEPVLELCGR
jgi:hypothetical protein